MIMEAIWINNILYEHQEKVLNHYNLEPADEYVKKVFPNAVYMEKEDKRTNVFIPHQGLLEANNFIYKIDEKWYDSWITSKHSELVKFYDDELKRKGYEQVSLF